ncbi:unnamed protein product [Bathycoccus prasinos]
MMALIQKHAVTPSHPSIRKWRHRAQSSCMKKNTTTYGEGKVKVISSKSKEDFPSESRSKSLFPTIDYTLNITDDMKLVENSEIEELAARLVFPENMELLKNASFTSKYRHSEKKLEFSIRTIEGRSRYQTDQLRELKKLVNFNLFFLSKFTSS